MNAQELEKYLTSRGCGVEAYDEPAFETTVVEVSTEEEFFPVLAEIVRYLADSEEYLNKITFDYENNTINLIG